MNKAQLLCFYVILIQNSIFAYNLDLDTPIIYSPHSDDNGIRQTNNSFFGYNVLLYTKAYKLMNGSTEHESGIIVGAPKANYTRYPDHGNKIPEEPGVVYRCPLGDSCVPINVSDPDDEVGFIDQMQLNTLIEKGHGWFGAAMALHQATGLLTVCAPRTIMKIYNAFAINYHNTMHGVCYTGKLSSGILYREDKNFSTFDFASKFWYNPGNGFAVHYPSSKAKMEPYTIYPVIGSPKRESFGTVYEMGQRNPTELPINDDLAQFGYALTSGYYFHEEQLMIAGGAPGWQYVGQVAIMDPRTDPFSIIVTINGNEIGEFFGSSLATGDLNKDGLDDLIVGSPHWKNDNGRVHIFLGNKGGFFEADILLEGAIDDALYGYAVTSGDLDGDGYDGKIYINKNEMLFADLIIGAPWEKSGVIYVYNGDAKLHELKMIKPSQRIVASSISNDLLRFGFSLAKPVDVDDNGFPDIAVGAYASGHAVILLSRPVLRTELNVSTFPSTLSQNSTSFVAQICVQNFMKNETSMSAFECTLRIDEDYKRFVYIETNSMLLTWPSPPDHNACDNTTFRLTNNSRNFIDVIEIIATHRLLNSSYLSQNHRTNCKLCPIEYKGYHSTVVRTTLPFDIGCGMDDICQAFIIARLFFRDVRNSTWIIGSGDLSLVLSIGNHAEPAYLTTVTFYIPKGITLKSILPSCQEEGDRESLMVTCDIDNPLGTAIEKRVSLDLDMNRMHNGSAHGSKLDFRVDVNTRSVNRGLVSVAIPLYLSANVSVTLSGKAYDESYYFNHKNDKPSTFQHTYQISRFGATPIYEARLAIRVPYKFGNLEYLTIANKPRIFVQGRFYECSVSNVSVSTPPRIVVDKTTSANKFVEMVNLDAFANNTRSRRMISERTLKNLPISSADTISHVRHFEKFTNTENNIHSELYTMPLSSDNADDSGINLNCSVPNVECGQITCTVAHLKTSQDVGKLQLQFVFDNAKITDEDDGNQGKVINFVTDAWLEVINPTMQFIVSGTGNLVSVKTTFHRASRVKNVSIWTILGSVLLGLVALLVLAIILYKIGFFKRSGKEKLETLKNNDAIPLDSDPFLFNE